MPTRSSSCRSCIPRAGRFYNGRCERGSLPQELHPPTPPRVQALSVAVIPFQEERRVYVLVNVSDCPPSITALHRGLFFQTGLCVGAMGFETRGFKFSDWLFSSSLWHWNLVFVAFVILASTCVSSRPTAALVAANDINWAEQEMFLLGNAGEVPSWGATLELLSPPSTIKNVTLILAASRTARYDPLNNFHRYRGGWNISEEHYWASVGFTAWPGFLLAAVWIAFGAILLLLSLCCCCCCRERLKGPHDSGKLFPILLLLLLFTSAALAGCTLLYIGQGKFHDEISDTLDYVVNQSDIVVVQLQNVSALLTETKAITVLSYSLSESDLSQIQQLNTRISSAANSLQTTTADNSHKIRNALNDVRLAMIIVAGVMLLLVLLGFFFAVLGVWPLLYLLIFIGWFLVAGTWILCGVYILLNNCLGDTCVAMGEWVDNPSLKTSLDKILPCVDVDTAHSTLDIADRLTNETVVGMNNIITNILNRNASLGPQMPTVCDPIQPQLSQSGCVNLTNAAEAWSPYICNDTGITCTSRGRVTPQVYDQLNVSATIISGLYEKTPFLVDLEDCQFVRNAFTYVRANHCHPLWKFSKWEYIGLALVSGGAMLSILFWIIYIRRRRHRHSYSQNGEPIYRATVQSEPKPVIEK
eukprot:c19333_g1_i1 orf=552-2480(-)